KRELDIAPDLASQELYRDILTDRPSATTPPQADGEAERPSLAVLPFGNLSADSQLVHLCVGIADDIITGLGRFRLLCVIDRYSSGAVARQTEDVAEIGRRLGITYLVQGSLQKQADRLRITVRLVNAVTRAQIWSETFDCAMAEVPSVPDKLIG